MKFLYLKIAKDLARESGADTELIPVAKMINQEAIQVGQNTAKRKRYHQTEITLNEIIAQRSEK